MHRDGGERRLGQGRAAGVGQQPALLGRNASRHRVDEPLLLGTADPGQRQRRAQIPGRELVDLVGEYLAHCVNLRLRTADGRDDELIDVGDEPGRTREEVKDAPDVGEVTHIRQKEDDEVIRVNGRPLLDPIWQRSEKCPAIRLADECVQHLHDDHEQEGGQRVALLKATGVTDAVAGASLACS